MPKDLPDYSSAARTPLDQEFSYLAVGMVAGAVPGIVAGFIVAAFVGHAAMWLSVCGGIGIVLGLLTASWLYRRRRRVAASRDGSQTRGGPAARH